MSTTIASDLMAISLQELQETLPAILTPPPTDAIEFVKCECCSLTEECTQNYIETVRKRFHGKWICGLCSEAVKDEMVRACVNKRLISTEEAMTRHINFCKKFVLKEPPVDSGVHLIHAMRQIVRRSLDSPRALRSIPSGPLRKSNAELLSRPDSYLV